MLKKRKRLAYVLVITGVLVVGLLLFTVNRGPLATGFRPYEGDGEATCLWCGDNRPVDAWDAMGTALITLLLFMIPSGHLVLLIVAAGHLNRPPKTRSGSAQTPCPHCGKGVDVQWKACPHCGEKL